MTLVCTLQASELQDIVNICETEFDLLDMQINAKNIVACVSSSNAA